GLQIHAQLIKLRLVEDRPQRNHLVNLYAKSKFFCHARNLLDESPEPDLISWSSLIAGYVNNGMGEDALFAFRHVYGLDIMRNQRHRAFPIVLKACGITQNYVLGKQTHGIVTVSGFDSDVYVANALMVMYAKCGDVGDSRKLFDRIPEKNVVCWNAMLSSYVQNDRFAEAMDLFVEMVANGNRPDEYCLSTALNAVTGLGKNLLQGMKIHGYLIKHGLENDPFSSNALVDMYSKSGNLDDSVAVFENLPGRDVISWNSIIAGCVLHEEHYRALGFLNQMKRSGTCPNLFTLSSALKSCAALGRQDLGKQFHAALIKLVDLLIDPFLSVGLIDMYCKCNLVADAEAVFHTVPVEDSVSLNALLCGHSQNGDSEKAAALFSEMHRRNKEFDQATLLALLNALSNLESIVFCRQIHGFATKTGYLVDLFVLNSFIHCYGKCSRADEAARVFEECGNEADIPSYTSMMTAYSQCGEGEEALKLYSNLLNRDLKPDSFVCSSLLNACANLSAYEQGKLIHVHALKLGFTSDAFSGNSLVNMYAKCGSIDEADRAFSEVPEKTVVSWSAMIGGLAQHGHGKRALGLFDRMLDDGVSPNHVTLVSVLSACSHSGLVQEARWYFDTMKQSFGIEPTGEHYACMIDVLGRAGKLGEALETANRMPFEANASIWGALLGAAKLHKNVELGALAAEKLHVLEPDKSGGTHVLLANVYASAGQWREVKTMRRRMKDERVKKEPGMSWVEVKDEIHTFVVGDRSHRLSDEIYGKLEELGEAMAKAGYVPVLEGDLHNVGEREKEALLSYHSEKLAVAFSLIVTPAGAPVRVKKNLRICLDCHTAFRYMCRIAEREIVVRDVNRFHHFKDGVCSCGEYW
ncbi:hypothetical protein M569_07097, partial [Genlisea aurea]